jgi:glycosyltransferase involved in cell wall biosynthesis
MTVGTGRPHILCVGGEDHALRIPFLRALAAEGFRVTACASGDPAPFAQAGIACRRFAFGRFVAPLADRTSVRALRALLAEEDPDLVQTFDTKPNLLAPLAVRGLDGMPVVRTINGLGWVYSARTPTALALRPVQRVLHRLAARTTAATVFQNRDDMDFFTRHRMLGDSLARLIPGSGIDIPRFAQAAAAAGPAAALRMTLGLGTAEVVLTVTRLTRQKGIPTLLQAAALVHAARPGVRFLLVGPRESEGPLAVSQAEIERHAPYVMATGPRSDVPALLGIADAFAFPTEYREGVPRALLEAGLAALPIVATAMPGCNDVIRDGWSGYLVPPRRPAILAARILALLSERDTARAMGRRAQERVMAAFGLDLTVARYRDLYAQVLGVRVSAPEPGSREAGFGA